jgi:hypothetical protein
MRRTFKLHLRVVHVFNVRLTVEMSVSRDPHV